jgi:hypothetical protein
MTAASITISPTPVSPANLYSTQYSSENIEIIRQENAVNPFDMKETRLNTGLNYLLRHGKSFENETKQPFTY